MQQAVFSANLDEDVILVVISNVSNFRTLRAIVQYIIITNITIITCPIIRTHLTSVALLRFFIGELVRIRRTTIVTTRVSFVEEIYIVDKFKLSEPSMSFMFYS